MSKNPTIDAYNKYAHIYDEEVESFWENFPQDFINTFVSHISGKSVLDIGSGSGRDAIILRNKGLEVICLDASEAMVKMTSSLGFESYLATFSEMDFPSSSFDGVWAYTSLIHIQKKDAKDVIATIRKILKPNGIFAIGVIQGNSSGMVERKTMPDASRYFKNYTSNELKELIEPLGFTFIHEQNYQPRSKVYINQIYKII